MSILNIVLVDPKMYDVFVLVLMCVLLCHVSTAFVIISTSTFGWFHEKVTVAGHLIKEERCYSDLFEVIRA